MLTQKDQRIIRSKLDNIYKIFLSKKDIDYFEKEIVQIVRQFNKKNPKKKKNISEKTTLVICYGDNVYSEKKKSIKVFQAFFQKAKESLPTKERQAPAQSPPANAPEPADVTSPLAI